MPEVSITVPEQYAAEFKKSAKDTLDYAQDRVGDVGRESYEIEEEAARVVAAARLWASIKDHEDGPLEVRGDSECIEGSINGALWSTTTDLYNLVDGGPHKFDGETFVGEQAAEVRAVLGEIEDWLALLEGVAAETAREEVAA